VPGTILQLSAGSLDGETDALRCPTAKEAACYASGSQYFEDAAYNNTFSSTI